MERQQYYQVSAGGMRADEHELTHPERTKCIELITTLANTDSRYWPDAAALQVGSIEDANLDRQRLGFAAVALSNPRVRKALDGAAIPELALAASRRP